MTRRSSASTRPSRWADLHMHSRASDGAYSPAYLMELASIRGLAIVSLTDHDTIAGLAEASAAAANFGMQFINGVELDAAHHRGTMHILGYGFDVDAPSLTAHIDTAKAARAERNQQLLRRLDELGIVIDVAGLLARRSLDAIGRPHIADLLIRAGHVRDFKAAFRDYLGEGAAAWQPSEKPLSAECISAINHANGVAVLAHPFTLGCESDLELETIIARLVSEGLGGVEVWHPSQNANQQQRIQRIAKRFDLVMTGGSDLHFVSDHEKRGAGFGVRIDAHIVVDLLSRKRT